MDIKWNEYTWYSKTAAAIFFIIIFPIWAFYLGMQYLQTKEALESEIVPGTITTATTTTQVAGVSTTTPKVPESWTTQLNDKYGYSFKHPSERNTYNVYYNYDFSVDPAFDPHATSTVYVSLSDYARNIWSMNRNDKNPNFSEKRVSDLQQTMIKGRVAYTFTVTHSFEWNYGAYILDEQTTYVITANQNNQIFVIHYPTKNATSSIILSTLSVDTKLIAPKIIPANWKEYSNKELGFSFSYPVNIFPKNSEASDTVTFAVRGRRGGISAEILDKPLNPATIEDMYGPIENPTKIKVGERDGYRFGWGDAGCFATRVDTALANNKTLRLSFGSCYEDLYPIALDRELQTQILTTFKFTK